MTGIYHITYNPSLILMRGTKTTTSQPMQTLHADKANPQTLNARTCDTCPPKSKRAPRLNYQYILGVFTPQSSSSIRVRRIQRTHTLLYTCGGKKYIRNLHHKYIPVRISPHVATWNFPLTVRKKVRGSQPCGSDDLCGSRGCRSHDCRSWSSDQWTDWSGTSTGSSTQQKLRIRMTQISVPTAAPKWAHAHTRSYVASPSYFHFSIFSSTPQVFVFGQTRPNLSTSPPFSLFFFFGICIL